MYAAKTRDVDKQQSASPLVCPLAIWSGGNVKGGREGRESICGERTQPEPGLGGQRSYLLVSGPCIKYFVQILPNISRPV